MGMCILQRNINKSGAFGAALTSMLRSRISQFPALICCVGICMVTSIAIEAIQWIAGIGLAETDDVISNTIGGLIGSCIAAIIPKAHSHD